MKNSIKKTVPKKELIDQLLDQKFDNLKVVKGGACMLRCSCWGQT